MLDVLLAAAEAGVPSQSQTAGSDSQTSFPPEAPKEGTITTSRGLLDSEAEPVSKRLRMSDVQRFDQLWRQAVEENMIVECDLTRSLKALASASLGQQSAGGAPAQGTCL